MKSLARAVISLGIGAALGCASPSTKTQQPSSSRAEIAVQGTYLHVVSQLEFPEAIGPFDRTVVRRWDPGAFNVSAHYRLANPHRAIATVYHYPATADGSAPTNEEVAQHFRSVQQEMMLETPSLYLLEEAPYQATINGVALRGFKAVYQAARAFRFDEPVDSTAYLFVIGPWFLKFRVTYPRRFAAEMEPLEKQFISSFRWPVSSSADSGERENLCQRLAESYELIAKVRDAGVARDDDMLVKKGAQTELARRVFVNSIDFAYANPDKSPAEIRDLVLGDCELDGDGKPALRTLWPWRR